MECIFPFVDIDGQTHESCTKSRLANNIEYIDDEIFYWCATEVDEDRNMKAWGKCDESTCQTGGRYFYFEYDQKKNSLCNCTYVLWAKNGKIV